MEQLQRCPGVYIVVNDVNGHCYIGSSVDVLNRVWEHLRGKRGSPIVRAAMAKHGAGHFHAFLVERAERANLPAREAFWIAHFEPEYNASLLTISGGRVVSEAQRAKISAALTGRKLTPAHRSLISASLTGHATSPETVEKLSAALARRKHRPESIEKMRAVKWTEERRKNASAAQLGKSATDLTKAKKSAALKGKPWSVARRAAEERRKQALPHLSHTSRQHHLSERAML